VSIPLRFGDAFSGTADQLVHHAIAGAVDIRAVPMSPAVRQLVAALAALPARHRLRDAGDELTAVARALRLKSTAFLPEWRQKKAQAEMIQEEERERRQRELEADRALAEAAARWLGERLVALGGILEVEDQALSLYPETEDEPPFPSLWTLGRKFQWLARQARTRRQARERVERQLVAEEDDCGVREMIAWAEAKLRASATASAAVCADPWFDEAETARRKSGLLLALLEMARGGYPVGRASSSRANPFCSSSRRNRPTTNCQ
jgi:chromatin segregation and condensation protein Rec8/ScpA/Scc1 (kleisin family)